MMGGVQFMAWYPITPSSSLAEALIDYAAKHRIDPETGESTFAVVQAEDELAALGMVLGAGWAGARAMTTTSGPGISLMSEFTGLGYYAEVPAVIIDVQRVGPSTGLPTRTMQGDITSTYYLSHGDAKHILLLPGSVEECYQMAMDAFDLAERFQTPVFLMTDLDLGMNNWMADPFPYPDKPLDRGKVLRTKGEFEAHLAKFKEFARYRDVDGDGIPYRTLPGFLDIPGAAYFTRGSGHNERANYTERPDDYKNNLDRLARKLETAKAYVPKPVVSDGSGGRVGVIAYGSSDFAVEEARALLARKGLKSDYLRLRALPFTPETAALRRRARSRLRRRPEPGRPDVRPAAPGSRRGRREAPLDPPLRRLPPRRRDGDRRDRGRGEELMSCNEHDRAQGPRRQPRRPDRQGVRRAEVDALRRLRPRRHHPADHAGDLRDVDPAAPDRQDVGHRLLLEDHRPTSPTAATASTPSTGACRPSRPGR